MLRCGRLSVKDLAVKACMPSSSIRCPVRERGATLVLATEIRRLTNLPPAEAAIPVQWSTEWTRWDGLPYTESYPVGYTQDDAQLVYVLTYSNDGGKTWLNMMDDSVTELGVLPWIEGVGPDPAKTLVDQSNGADETCVWDTPRAKFPQGSYLVRIEGYRAAESLHDSHHVEKIYVNR